VTASVVTFFVCRLKPFDQKQNSMHAALVRSGAPGHLNADAAPVKAPGTLIANLLGTSADVPTHIKQRQEIP
jgi:hypothetical protein